MESQKTPPSLRELQLWLRWIVTDPRGVQEALANPFPSMRPNIERYTSPSKTMLPWIVDAPPIDKTERLDIYAEAYFARVLDSMNADFPITARVLGEASFQKLVSDYLKQYPSQSFNIGQIGQNFSSFVANYEDLKTADFLESIVAMEWLMIECFYAQDSGQLETSSLTSLSDEDWEKAEFKLAPSVRLVDANWPLDLFWNLRDSAIELDSVQFEKLNTKRNYLIVRERGSVSIERLSGSQCAILKKLACGASLMSALEDTQNEFLEDDIGSQLMNWFNSWISRGIICGLKIKKDKVTL